MSVGFSKARINPPLGMQMEGLSQKGGCTAIHDDLWVRALFLQQGNTEVLILSFDLLFFERYVADRYKGALGRKLGLRPDQIVINTTHTHSGPRITRWAYSGEPESLYLEQVEEGALMAAEEAKERLRPVTLHAGITRTDLPVSRRKLDENGKAHWRPSRSRPICDALPFCVFKDAEGCVVATLFSVACHPSMNYETVISAEYPGVAVRKLNEYFQTDGCIFLQGAAGDTKPKHVAVDEARWRAGSWDEMEAAGTEVADAVIAAVEAGLLPVEPDLKASLLDVVYPLSPAPSKEDLEAVRENADESPGRKAWAADMLAQLERKGSLCTEPLVGVHFLQLARGLRLVGVEGEVLTRLGLRIQTIYDKGITFVLGYTNGTRIYMPVTEELPEEGYEVESAWEYHHPSRPAPGCEIPLLEAICAMRDRGDFPNE